MNQLTTCLYCGMAGAIRPLVHAEAPTDMHAHQCGTLMYIHPDTGEVYKCLRAPACEAHERVNADMELLTVQVRALIADLDERKGYDDDPY